MLVILSGVSGAGKDTIKKELLKREDNIVTIPSITDRAMREGEEEGTPYHFVSTKEFERMISDNELYEYNVHHNHYYGTSKKIFNDKNKEGKIIVKDIDVNGTENLVEILKEDVKVVTIFLGLMFVIMGNYMPKTRRNRTIGFRFPWTLYNENTWLRSNRFASYVMMIAGVITIIGALLFKGLAAPIIMLTSVTLSLLVIFIYAYFVYRDERKKENEGTNKE